MGMKINCKHVEQAVDLIFNQSAPQNYIKVLVFPLVVLLFSSLLIICLVAMYSCVSGDKLWCHAEFSECRLSALFYVEIKKIHSNLQ